MRYKLLGNSGLRVSELALGTMTFGEDWGPYGASKEESRKVFEAYVEAGGNFIDTANIYLNGTSEKFVGEFIASRREEMVLATKYSLNFLNPKDPNAGGAHRKNLVQSVEASLKRLNTDYIDVLWLHFWDILTPVEEVMRAMDDLVRSGKVLYVGISDAPAWVVSEANAIAKLRGWSPFIGLQIQYSLIERTVERELLPMAKQSDIGVTVWSPLGQGLLSGKYTKNSNDQKRLHIPNPMHNQFLNERNLQIAREVDKIAEEMGRSSAQVALNWVRQQQDRGVIIPIIGARTETQLKDNLGCLEFELSQDHIQRLNDISKVPLGFPHDFLAAGQQQMYANIDNHRK
ncbi:aldo/keto reductase [Neobacillus terrae]|uniref:aldo/keto reductase n=1 Tax=Neobacillus terrae TaxID=3034837 RepID=UPI00140E0DF5|nr:aldo/keto reductase [Neobacillus terrae]NHM30232.1 aldo/keto reductase [Neobacillus terrae]